MLVTAFVVLAILSTLMIANGARQCAQGWLNQFDPS